MPRHMTNILVTGASKGIGRALAVDLASRGHGVIGVARDADRLATLRSAHSSIETIVADVTSPADRQRIAQHANDSNIDVLVNGAAVCWPGPLELQSEEQISSTVHVSVTALVLLTRDLLPALRRSRDLVVNISSVAGRIGSPGNSVYRAAMPPRQNRKRWPHSLLLTSNQA